MSSPSIAPDNLISYVSISDLGQIEVYHRSYDQLPSTVFFFSFTDHPCITTV